MRRRTLTVTFGASTISRTQVQLWFNKFKEGREDDNNYACPGRSSTSATDENIEAVKKMGANNCRITIREIADGVAILFGSCQAIFTNMLGINHVTAKIVTNLIA